MELLKLSEIIGQEITDVRFRFTPETDEKYSVQSFHTFIKLANNRIIDIPNFDDDDYLQLSKENQDYFQKNFRRWKFD